jgi:hypothetical protein
LKVKATNCKTDNEAKSGISALDEENNDTGTKTAIQLQWTQSAVRAI